MKTRLSTAEVIKNAEEIFHRIRWKNGIVVCPYCGSIHIKEYGDLPKVKVYKKNKFTLVEIRDMLYTGIYSSIEQNGRVYTKDNIDLILSEAEGLLASNAR